jgi:MFS family permease
VYSIDWATVRARVARTDTVDSTTARARAVPVSRVVYALGFTSLFTDISSEMVSSILPVYLLLHLHVSPVALGVIDGLYQGFAILVRLGAGLLADKWKQHKAVALAGYGLSAACRLGLLAVGTAWTGIATVIAVDRMGKGVRTAPRDALITLSTPASDLGRAFGVHRSLDAVGALLGPLAAFLVLAWIPNGYDVLFVISFGAAVIGVGILFIFVAEPRRPAFSGPEAAGSAAPAWSALLQNGSLRRVTIAACLLSVTTVSDSFIFLSLQQRGGLAAAHFPLLFVGVMVVNLVLSAPLGRLADRLGRTPVFLAGHLALVAVYAVLLMAGGGWTPVVVCLALLGFYYAATDGVLAALTSALMPASACAGGLAIVASATNLGRLVASIVFGALWAVIGLEQATLCFLIALMLTLAISLRVLGTVPSGNE